MPFTIDLALDTPPPTPTRSVGLQHAVELAFATSEALTLRLPDSSAVTIPFATALCDMLELLLPFLLDVATLDEAGRHACAFSNDYEIQFDWYVSWSGDGMMQVEAHWIRIEHADKDELPSTWEVDRARFLQQWAAVLDVIHQRVAGISLFYKDEHDALDRVRTALQTWTASST